MHMDESHVYLEDAKLITLTKRNEMKTIKRKPSFLLFRRLDFNTQ